MRAKKGHIGKGFIIFIIPASGLFLKRGRFYDGKDFQYSEPMSLNIYPTYEQAEEVRKMKVKSFNKNFMQKYSAKVLEIQYHID